VKDIWYNVSLFVIVTSVTTKVDIICLVYLNKKKPCSVGNWICHKSLVKFFYHKLVEDLFNLCNLSYILAQGVPSSTWYHQLLCWCHNRKLHPPYWRTPSLKGDNSLVQCALTLEFILEKCTLHLVKLNGKSSPIHISIKCCEINRPQDMLH
jgi:hypothetical protein